MHARSFLGASYSAQEAYEMGMVNAVVPHAKLEQTAFSWAKEIMTKSPTAIKMLKFGFNLIDDGLVGQQVYAGEATRHFLRHRGGKGGGRLFGEEATISRASPSSLDGACYLLAKNMVRWCCVSWMRLGLAVALSFPNLGWSQDRVDVISAERYALVVKKAPALQEGMDTYSVCSGCRTQRSSEHAFGTDASI